MVGSLYPQAEASTLVAVSSPSENPTHSPSPVPQSSLVRQPVQAPGFTESTPAGSPTCIETLQVASLCDWVANGDLVKLPEKLLFLHPEFSFLELCQQLRLLSWLYLAPPFTPAGNLISVPAQGGQSTGKPGSGP